MATKTTTKPNLDHIVKELQHLAIEVDSLVEDPENANEHDARSVEAIAASLKEFGQDQPLVVQKEGMVIRKGNGRWLAAKQLGWTHIAAVVVDESRVRAVSRALADNRSNEFSNWNDPQLLALLEEVHTESPDLVGVIGWNDDEYNALRDADTAFLDDDDDGGIEVDDGEGPSAEVDATVPNVTGGSVTFTAPLSESQHRTVMEAIVKARKDLNSQCTTGDAITHICEKFLGK